MKIRRRHEARNVLYVPGHRARVVSLNAITCGTTHCPTWVYLFSRLLLTILPTIFYVYTQHKIPIYFPILIVKTETNVTFGGKNKESVLKNSNKCYVTWVI